MSGWANPPLHPEQILITAEIQQKIQKAVEALPPRCKMIFKLVREDGLRYKEIAEILNISVNTIDVQMAIAVKRISMAIESEFDFSFKKSKHK
jgi:RNA polymerase sigma factor (sigma-70 family)